MLNILVLNPDPRRTAGCNLSLLGIIAGLDATRFRVHFATPSNCEYYEELDRLGVHALDYCANNWWYPTRWQFHQHLAELRGRVDQLSTTIRVNRIRLVYTNAEYAFEGALAAAIEGIPHIWAQRVLFAADIDVLRHFPLSGPALAQVMAELSDKIVGNSNAVVRSFPTSVPRDKLAQIESGIDVPPLLSPHSEAKYALSSLVGIPPGCRIVLSVGRISPEKDLVTMVRTAACVVGDSARADTHFIHVGRVTVQTYREELALLCRDLGIEKQIHFLGEVPNERMGEIYRGADVFLLTSLRFEGFARVCAEAMLAELPTVATRCGGPEDYIQDGATGFLCDIGDVGALAQRILWILDNQSASRAIGVAAYKYVSERYDKRVLNDRWMTLFEELVSRPREHDSGRVLRVELLINMLTQIGQLGVESHEAEQRLRRTGKWPHLIMNNRLVRSAKSLLRRTASPAGEQ